MLTQIEELVRQLQPTDDPDELGRIDKLIRDLTGVKRDSLAELAGPVTGSAYRITSQRKAKRSYNSAGIVASFAEAQVVWTIRDLIDLGAVRMVWQWTGLRRAMDKADVQMQIAHHEIEDHGEIDAPHVGEVWESYYKIEGVQE